MATHSSVLAWRIPGMGEPGGLPFMGSHRVGHDWSNLAAAAAFPFSRGSSQPRDRTQVFCIASGFFTNWAMREAPWHWHWHRIWVIEVIPYRDWWKEKVNLSRTNKEGSETPSLTHSPSMLILHSPLAQLSFNNHLPSVHCIPVTVLGTRTTRLLRHSPCFIEVCLLEYPFPKWNFPHLSLIHPIKDFFI